MDLNGQQQPSQTPDDERSEYHPLPNLADDHITFVDLREEQDLPGIWEELDDILTERNNIYSYSTPQSVTNITPINLKSANAQIQKLTRIQASLQMYQGGSMSSHQDLSRDDTNTLVDTKVRAILADYKIDSNMQDKKRKRRGEEDVVVNQNSHPPDISHQHDDHPLSNNELVVEKPKGFNSSLSTPHIVGDLSGSAIKTAKKGRYASPSAKKAGSRCPIELVHRFGEDQRPEHQMTNDGVVGMDAGGDGPQMKKQSQV